MHLIDATQLQINNKDKVLSRRKRFLIFPSGSSFSVATCFTIGVYGNPEFSMMSWALNYGFAYELPTNSTYIRSFRKGRSIETKPMIQRRFRRDFFNRIEIVMEKLGYDGRECILLALCESSQTFSKQGLNMVETLIKTAFSFPTSKVLPFEHSDLNIYSEAYRRGKNNIQCQTAYPNEKKKVFNIMRIVRALLLCLTIYCCIYEMQSIDVKNAEKEKILSRKKRYLVFPSGSSFSVATCFTIGIYGNPNFSFISWGLNWGFAYELPTNGTYFKKLRTERSVETKPMAQRRHRRDFYNRMEIAMKGMGYNGRECILQALCESSQLFNNKKHLNIVEQIIQTTFSFPKSKVLSFEHPQLNIYDAAHRRGKNNIQCENAYPNCGFSLLRLALGEYSKPPINYM
ncbi:unnamed protein product [Diamesa serratosioi]